MADEIEALYSSVLDCRGNKIEAGNILLIARNPYKFEIVKEIHTERSPSGTLEPWIEYIGGGWGYAKLSRRIQLESQRIIKEDKMKTYQEYWGCQDCCGSDECPHLIEDKTPKEYYGVLNCNIAQGMDIADMQAVVKNFIARNSSVACLYA